MPALCDILDIMNGRPAGLATGHASAAEILALAGFVSDQPLRIRLLVSHVFFTVPALSVDQLRRLRSDAI